MEESSILTDTIMQQSLGFVLDCHVAMMANEQVPNAQVKEESSITTFGQNGHRYPTLLMYMKTGRKHGARM
jgi:hypothetical protein